MATTTAENKPVTVTVRDHEITVDPELLDSAQLVMLMATDPEDMGQNELIALIKLARKIIGTDTLWAIIGETEQTEGRAPGALPVELLMETITAIGEVNAPAKN